jgi:membrane protein
VAPVLDRKRHISYLNVAKQTFRSYVDDKAPRLGASLAYYTIFSLAPLLVVVVAIAGFVFGEDAVRGRLVGELSTLLGPPAGQLVETMLRNASRPSANVLATIVGIGTLLFGASGVFGELQDTINTIWRVRPKPGRGFRKFVRYRFLSFAMILGSGFLLLVSLVISAALAALSDVVGETGSAEVVFWHAVNLVASFAVITLLFATIFKMLPDVKLGWRDVWLGAVITSLLFTVGKFLIGLYLGRSTAASVYGASGALAIVLIWTYYSAQILIVGIEFTRALLVERLGTIPVADHAEPFLPASAH